MKRHRTPLSWILLLALAAGALAGGEEGAGGPEPAAEPIILERALPDPARRAELAAWWRHFEAARPALSVVVVRLRQARARWREGATREGCSAARRALTEVDSAALRRCGDYMLVGEIGMALDELDGATAACLERRYFEFDYRLQLAEAALAAARARAMAQLARPMR